MSLRTFFLGSPRKKIAYNSSRYVHTYDVRNTKKSDVYRQEADNEQYALECACFTKCWNEEDCKVVLVR